jgi:hypothetical protein
MTEASVTITLPGERPQSWNKAYAGQFWAKRKAEVERVRMAIRAEIDPETCQVFAGQVDITVTVFFDKRPLDADNVPAKFYVDACKGWILEDDDQHHVRSVRTVTALDPQRPRVVIEVRPVQNGAGLFCTPAGVTERFELQPAPEGSRVLVAGVAEDFERQLGQAARLMQRAAALA